MRAHEFDQQGRHDAPAERKGGSHTYQPFYMRAASEHDRLRLVIVVHDAFTFLEVLCANLGEADCSWISIEQSCLEPALERIDVLRHGWLAQCEVSRCARKAAGLNDSYEDLQFREPVHVSPPIGPYLIKGFRSCDGLF
ncbi:hypothetical protein AWB68_02975 [Caballeronia choica]|uniref:Uncharacterized protein n=1 Tax=Caballeronia choica TaxID=326476 RepID=A0A158ISS7_9BURK|nr:hypothetical protein AWB68_02975 [Caballeronia choica]